MIKRKKISQFPLIQTLKGFFTIGYKETEQPDGSFKPESVRVDLGFVEESAEDANNAATHAQTQGDYAKAQGDYSKTQGDSAKTQANYAKTQGDYAKAEGDRVLADKGQPGGLAELDESGRVPSSQLPSYVDDVINVATYSQLPNPGESGKIYITEDTNLTYRWSGSGYAEISPSLALGTTAETAGRGDWTQAAYNHSSIKDGSNPHKTTFASLPDKPTSLPASDVYPWAKAASKPTYTAAEVGALALSGGVLVGDVYIGGGLAIRDNTASHSNVIGLLNMGDGTFFTAVGSGSRRMVLYSSVDLYRDNGSTQHKIYDSSNFNPDNYLNAKKGLISDLNTATGSGVYYFSTPGSVNTPENYGSLLVVATVDNGSPWINQFAFGTSNKIWHRQNINNAGWNSWTYLYDSGNFNPGNYLLLSGGTMTGDIAFGSNGRSLRGSDGGNIAGVLYDTPNARYVTAIGTGSRRLILVSPASIYRGADGVAENYMIYDSGNLGNATTSKAGLMSAADKTKLDGLGYSTYYLDMDNILPIITGDAAPSTLSGNNSFTLAAIALLVSKGDVPRIIGSYTYEGTKGYSWTCNYAAMAQAALSLELSWQFCQGGGIMMRCVGFAFNSDGTLVPLVDSGVREI